MKRIGHIYEKVYEVDNIKKAIMKASLGKRERRCVKVALDDIDNKAEEISIMLKNKEYIPSPYTIKTIQDGSSGKVRTIYKPRFFPDQIIHWALVLQIEEMMMKGMYEYCCGSVPGRGTSYGQKAIRKWLDKDYKNTKYCLKMDIKKYYPSIDNEVLKNQFRSKIKDNNCLWLIDSIIDSSDGLPIGNYTSQWFANFHLQELDHLIKEEFGAKYYIRYVDDLVIFGSNKRKLHKIRSQIVKYLKTINLEMKDNWQVFLINKRALDFLGIRFFRNKTILRKSIALRIKRRVKKIANKSFLNFRDSCAIVSYWGWIIRGNNIRFYEFYMMPLVSLKRAKGVISATNKRRGLSLT